MPKTIFDKYAAKPVPEIKLNFLAEYLRAARKASGKNSEVLGDELAEYPSTVRRKLN